MNLQQFIKDTIANGGASYNLITGEYNPTTGYMVGLYNKDQVVPLGTAKGLQYDVADFIKDNAQILLGGTVTDCYFLGSWVHEGEVHLDISANVLDLKEALFLGKKYGQLAIWDCANKCEIKIN